MRSPLRVGVAACLLASIASQATAQTLMPLPPCGSTFSANLTRGYWFQSPANIIISGLRVPDEAGHGFQNVEVYRLPGPPPPYPGTGSGVQVLYQTNVPSSQIIPASILVNTGEYIGILGACGDSSIMHNSYTNPPGPYPTTILGQPATLDRFLTQSNIVSSGGNQPYSSEPGGFSIARVEMYYTAQSGLFASFSATPTSGPTPLNVSFTDTSFSSAPGGVTSWAWDLNGDTIIDSTAQNPSFNYTRCGYYTVSLTVTDSQHPPSTRTETQYIQADPQLLVQASFITSPTGTPLQVQFTDTSAGSPTQWLWDLNGDSIPDSALQNPVFSYPVGGVYNVTFAAGNACGINITSQPIFVIGNDECTGAQALVLGGNGPFSNVGASTNPNDPPWLCGGGGADIWFSYTVSTTGTLLIDTCGSSFDTTLESFSGNCASLASLLCNDDFCGLQSSMQFPVTAAQTVYFRVGGFFAATGSFVVNISEIPPLANDECVTAVPIGLGQNGPFSNVGATDNPLDPPWPCAAGGSDVWYSLQVPCALSLTVETCRGSNYDTAFEIFSGTCGALTSIICNDDFCGLQSSASFSAVRGTTYYIRVGGFVGSQGSFTLDLSAGGNGAFFELQPGFGQATLVASGSPNLGGSVTYQMQNVVGTPQMWFGIYQFAVPLCPGAGLPVIFTSFDLLLPFGVGQFSSPVPCDPNLRGRSFYLQGLDFGGTGGCNPNFFGIGVSTTGTIATRIG